MPILCFTDFEYLDNIGRGNGFDLNEPKYRSRKGIDRRNLYENDELESLGFSIMGFHRQYSNPWKEENGKSMKNGFLNDNQSIMNFLNVSLNI